MAVICRSCKSILAKDVRLPHEQDIFAICVRCHNEQEAQAELRKISAYHRRMLKVRNISAL